MHYEEQIIIVFVYYSKLTNRSMIICIVRADDHKLLYKLYLAEFQSCKAPNTFYIWFNHLHRLADTCRRSFGSGHGRH